VRAGIHQSITAISAAACVALAGGLTAAVTGGAAVAAVPTTRTAPTQQSTVVVRGLAFPEGRAMRLGLVGCDNVYERVAEAPQAMIGAGPGSAPAGERVLGYDLVGGNALGPLSYVSSVALTQSAGLTAYAEQGTTGVVWAGYQEPADRHTGRVWFGRAEVVVPPGQWTRIEATDLTYSWSKWDMYAQAPVADGVDGGADEAAEEPVPDGTLADMVLRHRGDGAGFVMTGLGCDGNEFAIDALRLHTAGTATTYDIEGLATSVTMPPPPVRRAEAGQPVELRGTLVDSTGAPLSGVTMRLESRAVSATGWKVDQVVDVVDGAAVARVHPEQATSYRWRFVDRPMAEGSVSAAVTIEAGEPGEPGESGTPSPDPTGSASPAPSPSPGQGAAPSTGPQPTKSAGPTKSPTSAAPSATAEPTKTPEPTKVPEPTETSEPTKSAAPSGSPSASADPSTTASPGASATPPVDPT
jgi:hypothetical protein